MNNVIHSSKDIEVIEDLVDGLVYLRVTDFFGKSSCSSDYTKEELVVMLKDMLDTLEE